MIPVSQIMTGNPVTVHRDDPIRKAFDLMTEGQFRRLPVIEASKLVGIITRTALLKLLVKMLKEKNRGDLK